MSRSPSPTGSDVSTTSTVEYCHLPFSELKVLLPSILSTLPQALPAPTAITRLPGGQYNRVVGLTFPAPLPSALLRITRNADDPPPLAPTIALLQHLSHTPIPVPRIIAYDTTTNNPLNLPYLLQTILPGQRLDEVYDSLSTPVRCVVAEQMAALIGAIERITFATPGLVVPATSTSIPDRGVVDANAPPIPLAVNRFPEPRNPYMEPSALPPRKQPVREVTPLSVKQLLLQRLQENMESDKHAEGRGWLLPNWEVLRQLIEALEVDETVPTGTDGFVLHHWDLEARNILVDPETGRFVGVLDWDQAQALPRVLGRRAPVWLWDEGEGWEEAVRDEWDGDSDEVEELVPKNEANRTVYERFMEGVKSLGGDYRADAEGEGRWVRRVWRCVNEGLWSSAELDRVERLLDDWNRKNDGEDEEMT